MGHACHVEWHSFSLAHATFCSCSCPWSCCGPPLPVLFPSPSRRPRSGTQQLVAPQPRRWTCPDAQVVYLVINKYIPPLASHSACPLSGFPFTTLATPVCCPLAQEALSFIHSFLPTEQCSHSSFDEKDTSHHPRVYQPHFGNRKRTVPTSGLTRKHTASQDKDTILETTFQCSQPAAFRSTHLPTFIHLFQQGAPRSYPTLLA